MAIGRGVVRSMPRDYHIELAMAAAPTPPFSVDALQDELRTILLFTADFLAMTRGPETAAVFIGFESGQYHREPPGRVNLALFPIAPTLAVVYDYAYQVGDAHRFDEDRLQDANVFLEGVPRAGAHPCMTDDGLCRRAVATAHARWILETPSAGDLSVRDLALLAGMTEGAVRQAS